MTIISAAGIVIAAAALFIVLSGFAGLKNFSLDFSSYVDPDLKISALEGKSFVIDSTLLTKLESNPEILGFSSIVEEKAILNVDEKRKIVTLKGVDQDFNKVTDVESKMLGGIWLEPGNNHIVTGRGITNSMSFGILNYTQPITIMVPKPGKGQITSIKGAFRSVTVSNTGVFNINEDIDNSIIYTNIETARYLLDFTQDQVTDIEFKIDAPENEESVREFLLETFDNKIEVRNKAQLNADLYKMLNTENIAVYLIFTLVIIIALFNVIGALIMMILDKKESLNTLFNLGTTTKQIRRIFFLQGSLMTVLGGVLGAILGLIIVFLQQQFNLVMITPYLPYPVAISFMNLMIVIITIVVLGVLASKLASARITPTLVKN